MQRNYGKLSCRSLCHTLAHNVLLVSTLSRKFILRSWSTGHAVGTRGWIWAPSYDGKNGLLRNTLRSHLPCPLALALPTSPSRTLPLELPRSFSFRIPLMTREYAVAFGRPLPRNSITVYFIPSLYTKNLDN